MHRILVIEDDDATRSLLREVLVDAGYEVVVACDGAHALPLLGLRPDLVVLDLAMPLMDGRAFLRRLRAGSPGTPTPVLIVTGDLGTIAPEMMWARALVKPFGMERFLVEVASLTTRSAAAA